MKKYTMKLIHNFTILIAFAFAICSCYGMDSAYAKSLTHKATADQGLPTSQDTTADRTLTSSEMTGNPDEFNSSKDDSTKKPLTSMELAKKYGYIGCLIKQIGTTYNQDGIRNNDPLPNNVTDLIIEFCKDDLVKEIPTEKLIQPQLNFKIWRNILSIAHNPIKQELALGSLKNAMLWTIGTKKGNSFELPIDELNGARVCSSLRYSPQGKLLAGVFLPFESTQKSSLFIWDLTSKTKQIKHSINLDLDGMLFTHDNMLFTHNENKLVIATEQNIIIYNLQTNELIQTLLTTNLSGSQIHITSSPNGNILAHNNGNGIVLWNLNDTSEIKLIPCKPEDSVIFGRNEAQRIYKCERQIFIDTDDEMQPHPDPIKTNDQIDKLIYCSRLGKYFFTNLNPYSGGYFKLNLLDLHTHKELISYNQYFHYVFSDDGSKLVLFCSIDYGKFSITRIKYFDLAPNLNKFTIERLRAMANGKI